MKHTKKFLALALVTITVLAVSVPAFALTWVQHYGPGTLNSSTGGTVKRYIRNLQYDIRFVINYPLTVDGYYGPQTKSAVRAFQRYMNANHGYNLSVDGIAGPLTKAALISLRQGCTQDHPND